MGKFKLIYSHSHWNQRKKNRKTTILRPWNYCVFWKTKLVVGMMCFFFLLYAWACVCVCVCERLFSLHRIHFIASITFFRSFLVLELDFDCLLLFQFLIVRDFSNTHRIETTETNSPDWRRNDGSAYIYIYDLNIFYSHRCLCVLLFSLRFASHWTLNVCVSVSEFPS